ncbi:DUF4191 domain-containing protein [Cellulomonas cellasea]|uniref:Membrane protein n=2 Tax=Cellulomonas cellasea TaxID=43670 RepID=A0A0A0B4M9_9CELL|nr:DUF4191 domain-containing protein [Cellulomonas cellasea]KGM01795.1 membrane protein [Cellulomonas cellasea DSM 20118]MBB2921514.1 hypothetical protein [Cellulomonas cellasea]GEA89168.1 hypothetical protein CCE01nite_31170 [Cellulomonas cellasea]
MAREKTVKPPKVKKTRWYHQVWQAYQMTRRNDPAVTWYVLGAFVGIIAVGLVIGLLTGHPYYALFVSLPFALLAAMFILARRAETAAYTQIEGQPGASRAALGTIRRGWTFAEEPVAVDPRTQDLVFRGVGRAGVVLVGEGPAPRVAKLLEAERKRTARVLSGVPITLIQAGNGEGQVPLRKLPRAVTRLKPTLTKQETGEVLKRLTALGAARLPLPKGIDPMRARPDRKGMRGR